MMGKSNERQTKPTFELRGERGPELVGLPRGTFVGTPHLHSEYVEGCFRCDLSRDEVTDES